MVSAKEAFISDKLSKKKLFRMPNLFLPIIFGTQFLLRALLARSLSRMQMERLLLWIYHEGRIRFEKSG